MDDLAMLDERVRRLEVIIVVLLKSPSTGADYKVLNDHIAKIEESFK